MTHLERIPADEQKHIENIIRLTVEQLGTVTAVGLPGCADSMRRVMPASPASTGGSTW